MSDNQAPATLEVAFALVVIGGRVFRLAPTDRREYSRDGDTLTYSYQVVEDTQMGTSYYRESDGRYATPEEAMTAGMQRLLQLLPIKWDGLREPTRLHLSAVYDDNGRKL